jgi:hypothetical protein
MFLRRRRQQHPEPRFWVELITAESGDSRFVRYHRLIRFPQLTMPLIAALTPPHWKVTHTDEIVEDVRFDLPCDLVGITANTVAAPHACRLAAAFCARGKKVVIGGPHAILLPFPSTTLLPLSNALRFLN